MREFSGTLGASPVNYKPRTKAGIIHDHTEKYVIEQFSGRDGILVKDFNGVFGMVLQEELFIRFKRWIIPIQSGICILINTPNT